MSTSRLGEFRKHLRLGLLATPLLVVVLAGCGSSALSAKVVANQLTYALDKTGKTLVVFSEVKCAHRSGDTFACRVDGLDGHWRPLIVTDNGQRIAWR